MNIYKQSFQETNIPPETPLISIPDFLISTKILNLAEVVHFELWKYVRPG